MGQPLRALVEEEAIVIPISRHPAWRSHEPLPAWSPRLERRPSSVRIAWVAGICWVLAALI